LQSLRQPVQTPGETETETAAATSTSRTEIPASASYNHASAYNHAAPLLELLMTSRTGTTTEASISRELTLFYIILCRGGV